MPRIAGAGVVAVLAVAFFVAGSPRQARREEIDLRRVRELQQLTQAIETYYRDRRELPGALDSLTTVPGVYVESIRDPVSRELYAYHRVDSVRYELCASFERPDTTGNEYGYITPDRPARFWRHGAGRTCYTILLPRAVVEGRP
jgi:hypothetical protein